MTDPFSSPSLSKSFYCNCMLFRFISKSRTVFWSGNKGTDLCIMSLPHPGSPLYGSRFHMANDWPFPHGPEPFPLSTSTIPDIHLPLFFHPVIISLRSTLSSFLFPRAAPATFLNHLRWAGGWVLKAWVIYHIMPGEFGLICMSLLNIS